MLPPVLSPAPAVTGSIFSMRSSADLKQVLAVEGRLHARRHRSSALSLRSRGRRRSACLRGKTRLAGHRRYAVHSVDALEKAHGRLFPHLIAACFHLSRSAAGAGEQQQGCRESGHGAGSASEAPGHVRTTALYLFPQASRSARCTVRWLGAQVEEGRARPRPLLTVGKEGEHSGAPSSTGRASTTTSRARRGSSAKPRLGRGDTASAAQGPAKPADFSTASVRGAIHSTSLAPESAGEEHFLGTPPGQASASARASANKTGRLASGTTVGTTVRDSAHDMWRHVSLFRRQ